MAHNLIESPATATLQLSHMEEYSESMTTVITTTITVEDGNKGTVAPVSHATSTKRATHAAMSLALLVLVIMVAVIVPLVSTNSGSDGVQMPDHGQVSVVARATSWELIVIPCVYTVVGWSLC
jgi:hypothetical protein